LKNDNENMQRSCEHLHNKINDLENKKTTSQKNCDDSHKSPLGLTKGQESLDKLLGSQCMSLIREALDLIQIVRKGYTALLIKETSHKES